MRVMMKKKGTGSAPKVIAYSAAALIKTLTNPNYIGDPGDRYGNGMDFDGTYIVAGATDEDAVGGSSASGIAYVCDVEGNLISTLHPPAPSPTTADYFGQSVAINNGVVVVGAYYGDTAGENSGGAYAFDALTGNLLHTFANPNVYGSGLYDIFGQGVAINSSIIAIAARSEDSASAQNDGKVYIFDRVSGTELEMLEYPTREQTGFGGGLYLDEDYLIIGVPNTSISKIRIYAASDRTYIKDIVNPNNDPTHAGDQFGKAISRYGDYIVVGAPDEYQEGQSGAGIAYVFQLSTGDLIHTILNPNTGGGGLASDSFGYSVSLHGKTFVVGAYADNNDGTNRGAAYMFNVETGDLLDTLPTEVGTVGFGLDVKISGDKMAIGAPYSFANEGRVYVFELS